MAGPDPFKKSEPTSAPVAEVVEDDAASGDGESVTENEATDVESSEGDQGLDPLGNAETA